MKLVDDWRTVHKKVGQLLTGTVVAFNGAWHFIAAFQSYIDTRILSDISIAMLILAFISHYFEPSTGDDSHGLDYGKSGHD